MSHSSNPLPVSRIVDLARMHPAQSLPTMTHQSYPFPVRDRRSALQMVFFYCHAEVVEPRDGLKLWAPYYVAYLDAYTGKFHELKQVEPGDFGLHSPTEKPIGKYLTLPERLSAEYLNKLALWYQAYDVVLSCFAARVEQLNAEEKDAVREFVRLTPEVVEVSLMPYYQAAARDFFDWLQRSIRVSR